MPRSNWKGVISFGLVSIPIVLFNSEDPSTGVSFKQINRKTGAKIKYKRVDVETNKEVPWEQIGKGYEYAKDVILPVEEGELERVAGENARTIAIEEFVDKNSINFLNIDGTYYLVPDKNGEKGYVILREALKRANKIGVAKVIISTKEYLAAVSVFENALVLHLLRYQEEIRDLNEFNIPQEDYKKYKVNNKEIEIAQKLIGSMTAKWKPSQYKDEYKEAVEKWVEEKANHLPASKMAPRSTAKKQTGKVIDFVDLLRKSLASSKPVKSRGSKKTKVAKRTPPSSKNLTHRKTAARH
ncbi:MAG: Ku protein [Gammaproteobacteria bacterium]|nr:Ku protein [Gammaproteobacteria bacterium]